MPRAAFRSLHAAAFGLALALVSSAAAQPIGASSSAGIEAADPAAAPGTNATPGIATLHAFLGAGDGFDPLGGLAADSLGNLYGTTYYDGRGPYLGTVFMLQRPTTAGGKWVYRVIYRFSPSYSDGNGPAGNLTVKDGIVYGTTHAGANPSCGCGEVFRLRPLNRAKTTWKYAIIHRFNTQNTGTTPEAGVTFGPDGALYGTTSGGGTHGAGTIFKLTGSGDGPWSFKPLRSLAGASGSGPSAELLAGKDGTLYGTTFGGGKYNRGSIFSLSKSGAFKVLYDFKGVDQPLGPKDGAEPEARLAFAPDGAIYGTTEFGGQSDEGTIFRLTKGAGGAWAYKIVHDFGQDGNTIHSALTLDGKGIFHGTASGGGAQGGGLAYRFAPTKSGGTLTVTHSFVPRNAHGDIPSTDLVLSKGKLYGTTLSGGHVTNSGDCRDGCGTVYELPLQ